MQSKDVPKERDYQPTLKLRHGTAAWQGLIVEESRRDDILVDNAININSKLRRSDT